MRATAEITARGPASLADYCFEAASGDGLLALWLAVQWTACFGKLTPKQLASMAAADRRELRATRLGQRGGS